MKNRLILGSLVAMVAAGALSVGCRRNTAKQPEAQPAMPSAPVAAPDAAAPAPMGTPVPAMPANPSGQPGQ